MIESEEAKRLLDRLWNDYVEEAEEQELDVPSLEPYARVQDFFTYMKETSSHCVVHDTDEIVTPDGRVCFECKHSYPDDAAITKAIKDLPWITSMNGANISYCPLCFHNW